MKKGICVVLAAILLVLAGCQTQPENSSSPKESQGMESSSEPGEELPVPESAPDPNYLNLPLYPIEKEEYDPEKLVWYLDGWMDDFPGQPKKSYAPIETAVTKRLNELLAQHGLTKKLEFRMIYGGMYCDKDGNMVDENPNDAAYFVPVDFGTEIDRLIENGVQVDLLHYSGQSKQNLLDLSPYFQSVKGQMLYKGLDEKIWKALEDQGKNYFVPSYKDISLQISYVVNRELMEKYDLNEEDLKKPLKDLEPVLQRIKDGEEQERGKAFHPLKLYSGRKGSVPALIHYMELMKGINENNVLVIDRRESRGKVKNLYEIQEISDQMKQIKDIFERGFIESENKTVEEGECFLKVTTNGCMEETVKSQDKRQGLVTIPISDGYMMSEYRYMSTCITAASQGKEEAFDVLALIMTNPQLSNLLIHGLEGENYTLQDGAVIPKENYRGMRFLGNDAIAYPTADQPKEKQAAYQSFYSALKTFDASGFKPDYTPVQDEFDAVAKAMEKYTHNLGNENIWSGNGGDVEKTLQEINQKLKDAGIQKLLDEVNRQLEQYYTYLDTAS